MTEREKVDVEEGVDTKATEVSDKIDTAKEAVEGENDKSTMTPVDRSSSVKPDKVG